MELQDLRKEIDRIDDSLIQLFEQRMAVSVEIARYKQQHGLPVYDPAREHHKLKDVSKKVTEEHKIHIAAFFALLFEISRAEQNRILNTGEVT